MKKPMKIRRLSLLLAALAVVFTTTILPWHFHKDSASASTPHCTVCHFSKEVRSASPAASSVPAGPSADGLVVAAPVLRLLFAEIILSVSSRAPPAV